jgi:hypothetical protein
MHPHETHLQEGHRLSLGRLLLEVVMIVFSILLALSLESCHQKRQHRETAAVALERIRAEISENTSALLLRLPLHEQEIRIFGRLAANPRARLGPKDSIPLGLNPPLLSATAFEAAMSTQALGYMSYEDVLAISRAYNVQRRMALIENNWLPLLMSPAALDPRHRADIYAMKHGLISEYVAVEKMLLAAYDQASSQIEQGQGKGR